MSEYTTFPRHRMVYTKDEGAVCATIRSCNLLRILAETVETNKSMPDGAAQWLIDLGTKLRNPSERDGSIETAAGELAQLRDRLREYESRATNVHELLVQNERLREKIRRLEGEETCS